ncbi:MAG TPA: hypothetical protein VMV43_03165 [Candidatus Nanopelagicaceae bacterium]|nr:hypothetical protein [Candidatus Nanopelagicaceae bacterium]
MLLTPLEIFYGSFTLISFIISTTLGILIALKYRRYGKVEYLAVGITWILLASPYWSDVLQFITTMIFGFQIPTNLYYFLANAFIALIYVTWIIALTKILFTKQKKILRTIFFLTALIFETIFLIVFFIDANLIGDQKSAFVVEWTLWVQIYLLISIAILLITGFLLARTSLKSDEAELRIKGMFLLIAFICFTVATVIDVIGADSPTEITILLARTFLIVSSLCFYIGFILPKFVKKMFVKQRD